MQKEWVNKMNNLAEIQKKLKAPKNQLNKFGNYNYRSCEDIVEAVKPLLGDIPLIITDDVVCVGTRNYVVATAKWGDHEAKGWACEAVEKKGMDVAQITGAASSYARKYALNGLFAIDDTKDADTTNDGKDVAPKLTRKEALSKLDASKTKAQCHKLWDEVKSSCVDMT